MKIAFCIRPGYDTPIGGDAVQMLKTKEYLEKNYHLSIDIITTPDKISIKYDIIHVFNFSTYEITKKFIQKAIEFNIPVVSSPIYWDYSYASTASLFNLLPNLNHLDELTINILKKITCFTGKVFSKPTIMSSSFKKSSKWIYKKSQIVAPNSQEEADLLLKWINIKEKSKLRIVYNANETISTQSEIDEDSFFKKHNIPKGYILQVGRIEYCKNQLNLVASLMETPEIPIVFVGKIVDTRYFNKIQRLSKKRGNVYYIDSVSHSEISKFYQYAKIHVLLSLRESPGLVNIEALSNRCPIITSDERFLPVKTYFPNQPYIVNPLNIKEIKERILSAYIDRKMASFDIKKFSWDTVSEQTYSIYDEVLSNKNV